MDNSNSKSARANNYLAFLTLWLTLLCCGKTLASAIEAEVGHWWHKGGDAKALEAIIERFETMGGTWFDAAEADFYSTRESVVSRLAKGYPPTAIQWNAGIEIIEFAQLGLINPITDPTQLKRLRQHYYPSVLEQVTVDDNVIAVPINVHNESWMWVSEPAFAQAKVSPPSLFSDIDRIAGALRQAGVVPLAVGSEAWQQRLVFMNVLLSLIGRDGFDQLFETADVTYLDSAAFASVVEVFTALSAHSQSFGDGSWSEQVAAVHRGEAAMLFMGDWAKGEFISLGGTLGVDFNCHIAPGVQQMLPVIDVFMLGGSDKQTELDAQRVLVEALLDKSSVTEFNRLKGSIPPFNDRDINNTSGHTADPCETGSLELLKNTETVLPPFASLGDGRHAGLVQNAIRELWIHGPDGWPKARQYFSDAILHENERRKPQQ